MAANKGEQEKEKMFNEIIDEISEKGVSLFSALKGRLSSQTFYAYIEGNAERSKKYARATELRAEKIAEDTLNIADGEGDDIITLPDGREFENQRVIARDRLKVDTRKWLLSKMMPKKYGDKISQEITGKDGKDFNSQTIIFQDISGKQIEDPE